LAKAHNGRDFAFSDQRVRRWIACGEAPLPGSLRNRAEISAPIPQRMAAEIAAQFERVSLKNRPPVGRIRQQKRGRRQSFL